MNSFSFFLVTKEQHLNKFILNKHYNGMLNTIKIMVLGTLLSFTTLTVKAPGWNIDKNHSTFNFEITHFFTPVQGTFKDFNGELFFDPNDLATSSANFSVKVSSVDTNNDKRDDDLRSEHFFEAEKYPLMKFVSSSFKNDGDSYVITGNLTIKDVTKEVKVPFKVLGLGQHPMKKNKVITALKGEFTLNRNDYGVGTGNWAATAVVGDEVKVSILLEASRNKD